VALFYGHNGNLDSFDGLYFRGDSGGDPVQYRFSDNSFTAGGASSTAGYSANVFASICGVRESNTSHSVYLNGENKATSATSVLVPSRSHFIVGARESSSTLQSFLNGAAGMAAYWDVVLTDAEVASLGKGFPPRRIRPGNLRIYMPLVRDVLDWRGLLTSFTDPGTDVADHPRTYGF
jgi:hypothetical protein